MRYIAHSLENGDIFVSTFRSARNMAYQGFTKVEGKVDIVAELTGQVKMKMIKLYLNNIRYIFASIL